MSQLPTDIVSELHGAADRAGLVCTKTGNFRAAMIDAAHLRAAAAEIERLRAERDEARRLLKAVVDMMRDNMAHDATHPHHLCDFIHRPDIGMCKVCEHWTDAMVMCYPDDFQDEEDGK